MSSEKTVGDCKKHFTCANPNMVTCDLKGKSARNSCSKCIDVTAETEFLLNRLKPTSGTLIRGVINLDAVPLLINEFVSKLKSGGANE